MGSWADIEALLLEGGVTIEEREGSRILIKLFNERRVFHRSHPIPTTDKGALASLRDWLLNNRVKPHRSPIFSEENKIYVSLKINKLRI